MPSTATRQRTRTHSRKRSREHDAPLAFHIAETDLGWIGLIIAEHHVQRLVFGFDDPQSAWTALETELDEVTRLSREQRKWITTLQRYASGTSETLRSIPLAEERYTNFQREVVEACRAIGYGEVLSYGELAERVNAPRAARAVGNVMRSNPTPLIVPCHRVIAAKGLGGYSARDGLSTKIQLLKLERASIVMGDNE